MCWFRINADDNDLPWPFTVDRYPSLVYFPARDKAESVSYPPHLPLTLPYLAEFVRRAAGPTADIGGCSRTCIRTNLRSSAAALGRLQARRSRIIRAIRRVRQKLKAFFTDPPALGYDSGHLRSPVDDELGLASSFTGNEQVADSSHVDADTVEEKLKEWSLLGHDSADLNRATDEEFRVSSTGSRPETDDFNRDVQTEAVKAVPTGIAVSGTTPDDEGRVTPTVEDLAPGRVCGAAGVELCNNVRQSVDDDATKADTEDSIPMTCSAERLLRVREELATHRRHLHRVEVERSLLRRIYTDVLLPAVASDSRRLERRRWQSVQYHRTVARLHLDNYRDYVSGYDMGS